MRLDFKKYNSILVYKLDKIFMFKSIYDYDFK